MEIIRISIAVASGYGPVDEAYNDKLTITDSSISYEYKPHEMARSENNIYRKLSYKTTSSIFKEIYKRVVAMTSDILDNDEILFCTDIGPTEIIVTFEDKHREKANFSSIQVSSF